MKRAASEKLPFHAKTLGITWAQLQGTVLLFTQIHSVSHTHTSVCHTILPPCYLATAGAHPSIVQEGREREEGGVPSDWEWRGDAERVFEGAAVSGSGRTVNQKTNSFF